MTIEDDKNVLAAEYVLGTLDADERALAEELIALDPGFEIIMQTWERRLGELSAMVDPVEPPSQIWERLRGTLPARSDLIAPSPPLLEVSPPVPPAPPPVPVSPVRVPASPAPVAAEPEPEPEPETQAPFEIAEEEVESIDFRFSDLDREPADTAEAPPLRRHGEDEYDDPRVRHALEGEVPLSLTSRLGLQAVADSLAKEALQLSGQNAAPPAGEAFPPPAAEGAGAEPAAGEPMPFGPPEEASPAVAPAPAPVVAAPGPEVAAAAAGPDMRRLSRRVTRWRLIAALMLLLALGVGALAAARELVPDRLPPALRPKPKIERVEVIKEVIKEVPVEKRVEVPSPKPAEYIAVLQQDEFKPAFLLTFDLAGRTLIARAVGAPPEPGKSYELWLISEKFPGPRSLGVIGADQFTQRSNLAQFDAVTINRATYGVSLEPQGGSPSGAPSGPMIYKGQLIQVTPPGLPMQSP